MRWLVFVMVLGCSPEMVTVCENRGSNPTADRGECLNCEVTGAVDCYASGSCEGNGCRCLQRGPVPMGPPEFREADCSGCGLYCEPPQLPCGARCVGPDEACPDRPSAWACRTREVPVE